MSCQFDIKCAFLPTTHRHNIDVTAVLFRHINPEKRTIKVAGVLL